MIARKKITSRPGKGPKAKASVAINPLDDPAFDIRIEVDYLHSTINLLMAGIAGEQIKVEEYDIRSGTVVNALYNLEKGVDRVQAAVERIEEQRRAGRQP